MDSCLASLSESRHRSAEYIIPDFHELIQVQNVLAFVIFFVPVPIASMRNCGAERDHVRLHICFAFVSPLQNAKLVFRAILWAWKYFLRQRFLSS